MSKNDRRDARGCWKRAVVGTARKLAVLMHVLWSRGEVYDRLYWRTRRRRRRALAAGAASHWDFF